MKKLVFVLAFLFLVGVFVSAKSVRGDVVHMADVNMSGCKNLYWIDNENKSCGQKEFCGAFMYYGLKTFEEKEECEREAAQNRNRERSNCTSKPEICTLEYMPVCGNDDVTYGNGCNACGSGQNIGLWGSVKIKQKHLIFQMEEGQK